MAKAGVITEYYRLGYAAYIDNLYLKWLLNAIVNHQKRKRNNIVTVRYCPIITSRCTRKEVTVYNTVKGSYSPYIVTQYNAFD